ncbi:MAG TPA: T9SS type A sorting domain-containing protein [Chitinophaga sp.]|uniref:Ig-like domain-containing protein n=1 Tax=Chitinophaga sp. TaxID=1869181 RepID=UPI002BCC2460|nr:T9SS type A sorting domain-containing protein [Chitinophaga sp.]HVI49188.1 T9SS type A sorting domain-containing protein [Chitinophaga sp.]
MSDTRSTHMGLYCLFLFFLSLMSFPAMAQTVPCEAATTQNTATSGICIGCYVDNAALAVDNNQATSSTLHVIVGLLGGYTQQQLSFPSLSKPGDSVRIYLTTQVNLLDLSVLGNIEVATYNGNTYNGDRQPVNNGLLQLRLLTSQQLLLSWAPAQPFNKVELRLNSGLLQLLNAISIGYAYRVVPQPTAVTPSVSICRGQSASLAVTGPAGVTYEWYKQADVGTSFFSGPNYSTGPVYGDSSYYVQASRSGCLNPQRTKIQVTARVLPSPPEVLVPVDSVCKGEQATFIATKTTAISHRWYNQPGGGTSLATTDVFTTTPLNAAARFYVEAFDTTRCVSNSRTPVTAALLPPGPGISRGASKTLGGTGGDEFIIILNTIDNGFLAAGTTASNDGDIAGQNHGLTDLWLVKLDSVNNKKWSKAIGTSGRDSLTGATGTKDGKYIVCGNYNIGTPAAAGQIIGVDNMGNVLWTKATSLFNQFAGSSPDGNNIVVVATTTNSLQLKVLNSAGTILKSASYSGNYSDDQVGFVPTSDNKLLIVGSTYSGAVYGKDIFMASIDSNLNREWEKVFLSERDDIGASIGRTGDYFNVTSVTRPDTVTGATAKIMQLTSNGVLQFLKVFGPFIPIPRSARYPGPTDPLAQTFHSKDELLRYQLVMAQYSRMKSTNPSERTARSTLEKSGKYGTFLPLLHESKVDTTILARDFDEQPARSLSFAMKAPKDSNNAVLYLLKLDSTGEIIALVKDTMNVFNPMGSTATRDGGALIVGPSIADTAKAIVAKIDPPSCLPATVPVFPAASIIAQQDLFPAYRESAAAVDQKEEQASLQVFPNPFSHTLNCRYFVKKKGKVILRLVSMNKGQSFLLREEVALPGVYTIQVNTSPYPSGSYLLQFEQEQEKQTSKVIKVN